jgi:hypothetical protein
MTKNKPPLCRFGQGDKQRDYTPKAEPVPPALMYALAAVAALIGAALVILS